MSGRLNGKTALVTGAGQGIGRAAAMAIANEGGAVVAASRTLSKMNDLPAQSPLIRTAALDVTDRAAVQKLMADAGPFDILVNAAGWVHQGTILECSDDDWYRSLDQNATSVFRVIQTALPGMLDQGGGAIVNVASVASSVTGVAARAAYGASKAALIGLTKAVARDFIENGIRCNALCPGTTHSPSLEARIQSSDDPEAMRARFIERQPMGRLGTIEEMAAAIVYLVSDDARFTTGTVLIVDGGQTL